VHGSRALSEGRRMKFMKLGSKPDAFQSDAADVK